MKQVEPAAARRSIRARWNRAVVGLVLIVVLGAVVNIAGSQFIVTRFRNASYHAERDASRLAALRADVALRVTVLHAQIDGQLTPKTTETGRRLEVAIRAAFAVEIAEAHNLVERRLQEGAFALWRTTLTEADAIPASASPIERLSAHRPLADDTNAVAATLDRAGAAGRATLRGELARASDLQRLATGVIVGLGLFMALLVGRFGRRLSVEILRPVGVLRGSANRLASGDLAHRVVFERDDELGDLAKSFNAMAAKVEGSHRHLTRQANHDSLTGLVNRAGLRSHLDAMLAQPERRDGVEAVLMVDLDDFKDVNDTLGHGAGDDLLVAVADRLTDAIRPGDVAARLGGDEFAILLNSIPDVTRVLEVAERIVTALAQPFPLGESEVVVGASVGMAVRHDGATADDILREADVAMYSAKGHGKNQVRQYDMPLVSGVAR